MEDDSEDINAEFLNIIQNQGIDGMVDEADAPLTLEGVLSVMESLSTVLAYLSVLSSTVLQIGEEYDAVEVEPDTPRLLRDIDMLCCLILAQEGLTPDDEEEDE